MGYFLELNIIHLWRIQNESVPKISVFLSSSNLHSAQTSGNILREFLIFRVVACIIIASSEYEMKNLTFSSLNLDDFWVLFHFSLKRGTTVHQGRRMARLFVCVVLPSENRFLLFEDCCFFLIETFFFLAQFEYEKKTNIAGYHPSSKVCINCI